MFQRLETYITFILLSLLISKQSKENKANLDYVPEYFVHITAFQCAAIPSLAVVKHSLTL